MEHSPQQTHNFNTVRLLLDDNVDVPEIIEADDLQQAPDIEDINDGVEPNVAQQNRIRRQKSKKSSDSNQQKIDVDTYDNTEPNQAQQNRIRRQKNKVTGNQQNEELDEDSIAQANVAEDSLARESIAAAQNSLAGQGETKNVTPGDIAPRVARQIGKEAVAKAFQNDKRVAPVATSDSLASDIASPVATEPILSAAEEDKAGAENEKWYKVTDKRKWSRVEYLGREVGPHSDMNFTAPIKWPEKTTEVADDSNNAQTEPITVAEGEKSETHNKATQVPEVLSLSEKYVIDMNHDPAIEQAVIKLDSVREQAADIVVGRHSRLLNIAGGKREALMAEYNQQILKLGTLINAQALKGSELTDSQKNVLVSKFLLEEQARLRVTVNKKMNKLATWENSYSNSVGPLPDTIDVVKAIEPGNPEDAKFKIAHEHLQKIFKKENHA